MRLRVLALLERDPDLLVGADPVRDGFAEGVAREVHRVTEPFAGVRLSTVGRVTFDQSCQLISPWVVLEACPRPVARDESASDQPVGFECARQALRRLIVTTVATHLAVLRAAAGRDVLLVDADDQATATDFTALRNQSLRQGAGYTSIVLAGAAVRTEVRRLAAKYDDVVIGTGGRDTTSQRAALTVSDRLLVPFVPRSFDVWPLATVADLVAEIRTVNFDLQALVFLNRTDPRGSDNADAESFLGEASGLELLPRARLRTRTVRTDRSRGVDMEPSRSTRKHKLN